MMLLGIDPGVTGAIAVFREAQLVTVLDMPFLRETGKSKKRIDAVALAHLLSTQFTANEEPCHVYLELAQAMPHQGVSSTFAYGRTNGIIEGVLAGLGMVSRLRPLCKVPPAVWKRHLSLLSNAHPKDAGLRKARQLYPQAELHLKKHHNRADAMLIGHYGLLREGVLA